MYTSSIMMFDQAKARQHDLIVQAEKHNRARQARKSSTAAQPSASRRGRRAWQLVPHLRPQTQP